MPELPEVETVRKQLEAEIVGAEIVSVEIRVPKIFEGIPESIFRDKVVKVGRAGKYLFVHFQSGRGLQIHLKMTGRLVLNSPISNSQILKFDYEKAIHTRVVMSLGDGRQIYYWDTRMFGYIKAVEDISKQELGIRNKLGPEPWDLSDTDLLRKLQKTGRSVKEAILDQSLLAGVGNIYANDGLWLAGINPKRTANSLRLTEVRKLRKSLCEVLERGLATGGASDNTYRDFYGGTGTYQNEFLVYGRTGESCNKCGRELKRIVVGGRGTWVCEHCQK